MNCPRRTTWALAIVLAFVFGAASCNNESPQPGGQGRRRFQRGPLGVRVAPAKSGRLTYTIRATGTAVPETEVKVSARTEGQILRVEVREGDRVEKGQLLVLVDDAAYRHQYGLAQAEAGAARARLAKVLAGNRPEEIAAAAAQVAEARSTLARTRAEIKSARAKKTETESNAAAYARMHRQGIVSPQQNLSAKTQAEAAAASLSEMEAKLRENKAKLRAAQARLQLMKAGARQEDVAAARSELLRAQENANLLRVKLKETRVVAAISAIVSERKIEPGDLARIGTHVLTLVNTERLRIRTQISELDLPKVKVDQPVDVSFDAYSGRKFAGRVLRIFPTIDPASRQATVEAGLENPGGKIPSGLLARLTFVSQSDRRAILVPKSALIRRVQGGRYEVFVPKPAALQAAAGSPAAANRGGPDRVRPKNGKIPGKDGPQAVKPAAAATAQGRTPPKGPPSPGARSGGVPAKRPRGGAGGVKLVAEARNIVVGEVQGDWAEVLSGLSEGERVVIKGQSRLRPGSRIRILP